MESNVRGVPGRWLYCDLRPALNTRLVFWYCPSAQPFSSGPSGLLRLSGPNRLVQEKEYTMQGQRIGAALVLVHVRGVLWRPIATLLYAMQ